MSNARSTRRRRAHAVKFTDRQLTVLTELYEKGLKDREIAKEMRLNKGVIKYQRKKHGLLHSRLFTDQELIDLHWQGLNDRDKGEMLGASEGVVFYHRKRLGLKANRSRTQG